MKIILPILVLFFLICPISEAQDIVGHTTITPDGVEIYYETQGEGVPILVIAGGPGGNPNFYRYTHKDWLKHGQMVYVHNRGRGRSQNLDDIENAYSVESDVIDIEAVRKALDVDKVIVYGHSYGGTPALLYAATYPKHCLAVITSCTHSGERSFQKHNINAVKYFLQRQFPEYWQVFDSLHASGVSSSDSIFAANWPDITEMYYFNPDNAAIMDSIWEISKDSLSVGFNYMVYLSIVGPDPEWQIGGTLKGFELLPLLHQVECPALIVSGRYDRICPVVVQKEIADSIPRGRLLVFERSGHRAFIEEPEKFFKLTGEFLDSVINKTGEE